MSCFDDNLFFFFGGGGGSVRFIDGEIKNKQRGDRKCITWDMMITLVKPDGKQRPLTT